MECKSSIIRQFGFRRILPLGQLALFLILVAIGAHQREQFQKQQRPRLQPVVWQEDHLDWRAEHPPTMPTAWLIAIAINVPATMLGAICAEVFRIGSNFAGLLCSSPFVLLLWLLVGRWLDRQLGFLPSRPPRASTRIACWIGIVVSAVLLGIGVMAFRSHPAFTTEVLSLSLGWMAWSMTLFVMCLLTLRRRPAVA
jgi:hypothetical protein